MSCGGCVKSVTKIIARAASLETESVEVELESGRATFPDSAGVDVGSLLEKLEAAGFPAQVATESD